MAANRKTFSNCQEILLNKYLTIANFSKQFYPILNWVEVLYFISKYNLIKILGKLTFLKLLASAFYSRQRKTEFMLLKIQQYVLITF